MIIRKSASQLATSKYNLITSPVTMCKSKVFQDALEHFSSLDLPPLRSYKRSMKPILNRKITSPARINLNRFWNEMEEFYDRYNSKKLANNNNLLMPDYTTDTYDHEREMAENRLNEQIENRFNSAAKVQMEVKVNNANRVRFQSYDVQCEGDDDSSSGFSSRASSPVWNDNEDVFIPMPPSQNSLSDLVLFMAKNLY